MYRRNITDSIIEALSDTPVILVNGARQTGKSTLCEKIREGGAFEGQFVTMDDPATLLAAEKDPLGFLEDLRKHVIIDEIQRAPQLFIPIKKLVDEDRKGRRIILTGSANVMMLPKVGDSLAGRIEIHNLWPLSQDEIEGTRSKFLHTLTDTNKKFKASKTSWKDIATRMRVGGYPESLERSSTSRRNKWFADYMTAILQKDIRDLANIEGLTEIPNVLKLIATRVGSTINMSDISRLSGIKNTTLKRYVTLLEHIFLIVNIPAWTKNTEGQFVKSPKVYLNDTGLLNHLIGLEDESFLEQRSNAGAYLENFVVTEIIKQLSWSDMYLKPYHFSIHRGSEVDLVLEDRAGGLYGIEIKSAASLQDSDFNGLRKLSELAGDKFRRGIVLYTGEQYLSGFGDNLQAVPIPSVWSE
jgi:predicted AAA+ superfamily ATPase